VIEVQVSLVADLYRVPLRDLMPPDFTLPMLDPAGVTLETRELSAGVYALLSNAGPIDNSGFVVGERGVLVVDAHINGDMGRQIQAAVQAVTDRPLIYLAHTNHHGDHTFGNHAFPDETRIVAHRDTASSMRLSAREKPFMLQLVGENAQVFDDAPRRLPDIVFEGSLRLDLGGRSVELHHFGRGNTPGDTVVYCPDARVAWTGNLVVGGPVPWVLECDARDYLVTLARLAAALDVQTIVPGHGEIVPGTMIGSSVDYFVDLVTSVRAAQRNGWTLEGAMSRLTLADRFAPGGTAGMARLTDGLHRWNVQHAFEGLGLDPGE
jgi:cyclase